MSKIATHGDTSNKSRSFLDWKTLIDIDAKGFITRSDISRCLFSFGIEPTVAEFDEIIEPLVNDIDEVTAVGVFKSLLAKYKVTEEAFKHRLSVYITMQVLERPDSFKHLPMNQFI